MAIATPVRTEQSSRWRPGRRLLGLDRHTKLDSDSDAFVDDADIIQIQGQQLHFRQGSKSSYTDDETEASDQTSFIQCGATEIDLQDDDASISSSLSSAFGRWYMNRLETHELQTKFVSSAILALIGDVVAQIVSHYMDKRGSLRLDPRRMLALFFDGLFCTGPLLHYVYELYEQVLPTHDNTTKGKADIVDAANSDGTPILKRGRFLSTLTHVLFDNFIMVVVYVSVLMIFTGLLEGRAAHIAHELRHDLMPAVKVSWKVSIMGYAWFQLIAFHFLPSKLRVLAVNVLDVMWVTVMSYVTHLNRH